MMRKVILVGVDSGNDPNFDYHMEELAGLAEACEMEVAAQVTQKLAVTNAAYYVGAGKVEEIRLAAETVEADCAVFDNSLKPSQQRNLQKALDLPVLDRTNLILEIFEKRARTKEAKLQVESASLQYMLPRLVGMREALSRQGGGAGAGGGSGAGGGLANRGAGEQKLELDRRKIEKRISELRHDLEEIEQKRATQRKKREKSELPSVALVGYTNAGKSTLLNAMLRRYMSEPQLFSDGNPGGGDGRDSGKDSGKNSGRDDSRNFDRNSGKDSGRDSGGDSGKNSDGDSGRHSGRTRGLEDKMVLEKDMLFATLDTTVRRISPGDNRDFLLSDTVGFIDRLPHTLIKAFRSTLAEACGADLLLQVVDCSDPHHQEQMQVTADTLRELGAEKIPMIIVMNKADRVREKEELPKVIGDKIFLSAKKEIGLDELLEMIHEKIFADYTDLEMLIPYTEGGALSYLQEHAVIGSLEYAPEGARVSVRCKNSDAARFAAFVVR
ncbi:MAG: GTPase HflX [Lachnospiraceae bacterium]|nr:GTPase HflX [Lachnospiraceae bacterium]